MKNLYKIFYVVVAIVSVWQFATAEGIAGVGDIKFAEEYAFSTNRAELIKTLRPKSKEWYVYSILNAQTEGRIDEAQKLLDDWMMFKSGENLDGLLYKSLNARQHLLSWDKKQDSIMHLIKGLGAAGIYHNIPEREVEVKPNMYPSALNCDEVGFDAFKKQVFKKDLSSYYGALENNFKFLAFAEDPKCTSSKLCLLAAEKEWLPDTPGVYEHLKAYLLNKESSWYFKNKGAFKNLTLAQLADLSKAVKGKGSKDFTGHSSALYVYGFSDFINVVMSKLALGADDDCNDKAAQEDMLKKRVAFAKSQAPRVRYDSLSNALRKLLEFYANEGDFSHSKLFREYLESLGGGRGSAVSGDGLIGQWLEAEYKAGKRAHDFHGYIEIKFLNKKMAECALLAGCNASQVDVNALERGQFEEIQKRVELIWPKSNKKVFSANDKVALEIDVKNVPKMRIAVYELDAAAACRVANGEVAGNIDLDSAVPTSERFVEFNHPSVVRHREKLNFEELKNPGLYVVEVSGQGVASRVLVRKGALRLVERIESSGHVFTALGEDGRAVKGGVLWVGSDAYKADENGEFYVPFAPSAKHSGQKTAIASAGGLATAAKFFHATETYSLDMSVIMPRGSIVAGDQATMLIRPRLFVSGVNSSLEILSNATLNIAFTDLFDRTSVKSFKDFDLSDSKESVCKFIVPKDLRDIDVTLEADVKEMGSGKVKRLAVDWSSQYNAISKSDKVEQLFLRSTSKGYILECRGRTGEKIASRPIELRFKHCAFTKGNVIVKTLQFNDQGVINLGELADIEYIETLGFGGYTWRLSEKMQLPTCLTVAQGEDIEIPLRGLFDGKWPGAQEFNNRVSLLALNKDGQYTADVIDACSYSNGILKIKGLCAGDYKLSLRADSSEAAKISVVRTLGGVGDGAVIMGQARALTDVGSPSLLRIERADVDSKNILKIKLANSSSNARVHVFATRTVCDTRDGASAYTVMAIDAERLKPTMRSWKWDNATSAYISGRDLGDKLRYILERRQDGSRIGNMLEHPSLILNPWTKSETSTKDVRLAEGGIWDESAAPSAAAPLSKNQGMAYGISQVASSFASYDFMPNADIVYANLLPDEKGNITLDISNAKGMQDVVVLATDSMSVDRVRLTGNAIAYAPRDLRNFNATNSLACVVRSKSYSSLEEIYQLLVSIRPDDKELAKFSFLSSWDKKDREEKIELYGQYACHELDFFIYEKDHEFFKSVIAPNLANKRLKDFMDKWLLGEDLSEYTSVAKLQDLNALELCLLARRYKECALLIARIFADWEDANSLKVEGNEMVLATALGEQYCLDKGWLNELRACDMEQDEVQESVNIQRGAKTKGASESASYAPLAEEVDYAWSNQRRTMENAQEQKFGIKLRSNKPSVRMKSALASREKKQLWRPPERTKQWVESYWYKRVFTEESKGLVKVNRFWCDYVNAIANDTLSEFRSANILDLYDAGLTEVLAALAVTRVDFAPNKDKVLTFTRGGIREGAESCEPVEIKRYFVEECDGEDVEKKKIATEFVRGKVYCTQLVVINPSGKARKVRIVSQIPSGAIAVGGTQSVYDKSEFIEEYGVLHIDCQKFYFPIAENNIGKVRKACVAELGVCVGATDDFVCNVVAAPSNCDKASWDYISQNGSKAEVLDFLRKENLTDINLRKMGWRFVDGAFAKQALDILDARGAFCQDLYLAGLKWKEAFDFARMRQVLARRENVVKMAKVFGPVFKSSLVEIEPEQSGCFMHSEYWPIINARSHSKGGASTITTEGLAKKYREFLSVLAAKKVPSLGDRLLAAVYLLEQGRLSEAIAQVEAAETMGLDNVHMRMQLDYLKAYLAMSRGDAHKGRELAQKWVNVAMPIWRNRFSKIITQVDEIAGLNGVKQDKGNTKNISPSLAVKADINCGIIDGVIITHRNLTECTLKAYPIDIEICFSKNPFGSVASSFAGILALKPMWSDTVKLSKSNQTRVELPKALRKTNLILVVSGADGGIEEKLELAPSSIDVQVVREERQLRVCDTAMKPIAGAYVKVYVRNASNTEVKFYKDGYTDLRGVFDYESVSGDSTFRPNEFAIFVESPEGVRTLKVKAQ